jgi:hypothetical protein
VKAIKVVAGLILGMAFLLAWSAFGQAPSPSGDRKDALYICACDPPCNCGSVSLEPGKCSCGNPLKWGHVVRVEGSEALVCTCGEGCRCKIDPKDATKCVCGTTLKRVSLKGTGIYFCNCMGSCSCNTLSSAPAKCMCGMDLKKAD